MFNGIFDYMAGQRPQRNQMQQGRQMPQQGLLSALSNQGLIAPPTPMAPQQNGAASALQGAQQNAIIMPAKKKDDGGGAGGLMTLFKLFMGG